MSTFIEYKIRFVKESEKGKAWLVAIDGIEYWIPKTVCTISETQDTILIAEWFDKKRIQSGAMFSEDNKHRYYLWRTWDKTKKIAMVIGLNPSTANANKNDPTIERLNITLARLGYGGLMMMNLFTVISSDPEILLDEKVRQNENADLGLIFGYALGVQEIIFAWGGFDQAKGRAKRVIELFVDAKCFGKNKDGSPWHPMAMMYAGLKPDSSKIQLFKFSDHLYENNIYDRKVRRQSGKKKVKTIPAEYNNLQGQINF
jgi:hypothetical protein